MFEPLFATIADGMKLSAEETHFIKSLWLPRQFRKGQFFQRIGDITTHGGFVVRGCFRTYAIDASGVESIIQFSPERAFIGDITSAVTGQPTLSMVGPEGRLSGDAVAGNEHGFSVGAAS